MSISHNWVVYSPKIMTKRRRKCKLRCESIVVILVISLYSILSWYQVKDLQDYYAALGNFCAFSLYFYALIWVLLRRIFFAGQPRKSTKMQLIRSDPISVPAFIFKVCNFANFSPSVHQIFKLIAYCSQERNQEIFLGETKPIKWG